MLASALVGSLGLSCTPPEEPFPNQDELEVLQSLHTPSPLPCQTSRPHRASRQRPVTAFQH